MIFLTHAAFGLLLGLLFTENLRAGLYPVLFMGITVFSSLLPDIDVGTSFLGRHVKPWNAFFRHRGFFHSLPAMMLFAILSYLLLHNTGAAAAVMLGYASHLFLDSLTPAGIRWFWPSKLEVRGKWRTGGIVDWCLFAVLCLGNIYVLFG